MYFSCVLKGNKDTTRMCQLAKGMRSAEMSREPQHHPVSRREVVGQCCQSPLLLEGCKKWPSYFGGSLKQEMWVAAKVTSLLSPREWKGCHY